MTRGWPVELRSRGIWLRPLARSDRRAWHEARERNREWLRRWDATSPSGTHPPRTFASMVRLYHRQANAGQTMPFAIEYDGRLVGQITVNNIVRGSGQFASVGYWIDQAYAGRGITTRALAMVIDHCLFVAGLHRVEVAIRPENAASLRVVEKLGIAEYGYAPRYLHIDGEWRDHRLFAITVEECPGGLLRRLDGASGSA
ncbi:N-acetyltransferase [Nocardioides mangrovicus]|uniref:N-acetyltransferase n=1 Tax=Nocardioides mangrovicus TaxID=2478913 RepID=A0A3L8NXQ1_9ACTN|nr:GNAT family protein [Nocardioides mangrovicus]RLV47472.1 N-acetyltransferase [Nocardioides mangrovicus]